MNLEAREKFLHTKEYIAGKEFNSDPSFFGNVIWGVVQLNRAGGQREFYIPNDECFKGEIYWQNFYPTQRPLTAEQERLKRPTELKNGITKFYGENTA